MSFDLSDVKTQSNEVLPVGKYICNVTDAELKDTKAGTGQYIKVELTIKGPEHTNRKIFTQFNVSNPNAQAAEIGRSQLKTLLVSAGYPNPDKLESVTALCGLTVGVKTKIKTDDYGEKAEVSYFYTVKKDLVSNESAPF